MKTIYVFNMQKFYDKSTFSGKKDSEDTMKGVPYVRRPLEESLWRDKNGHHTISFVEFLRELQTDKLRKIINEKQDD